MLYHFKMKCFAAIKDWKMSSTFGKEIFKRLLKKDLQYWQSKNDAFHCHIELFIITAGDTGVPMSNIKVNMND